MTRRRLLLALAVVATVVAVPLLIAWGADHHLRNFHAVEPGVLYRSGQLTPIGLKYALRRHRIRTVVTLRTVRDPNRPYLDAWEADVCAADGARHVRILPRVWAVDEKGELPGAQVVREFLAVLDDPANHPVLVHGFAGIHRTGTLYAVYRMESQGGRPSGPSPRWSGTGSNPGGAARRSRATCGPTGRGERESPNPTPRHVRENDRHAYERRQVVACRSGTGPRRLIETVASGVQKSAFAGRAPCAFAWQRTGSFESTPPADAVRRPSTHSNDGPVNAPHFVVPFRARCG